MKVIGLVRRVDDLGRVVIPKEVRINMGIHEGDPMEIFTEDGAIILKKYNVGENISEAIRGIIADIKDSMFDVDIDYDNKSEVIKLLESAAKRLM
jgi:AbrB family looped-hinge helix DNA binding protein